MAIRFNRKRDRLHVGYRAADWSDVWMEQKAHAEDDDYENDNKADGELEYDLYQFSTRNKGRREPMNEEMKWHQHFDPKNCDATSPAAKKKLQKRFLHDAFQYLTAKSAAQARGMERDLDKPREARWQSWFDIAKKYKRRQMPELRQAGDPGDDDDDDSAYDSDGSNEGGNGPMPPPNRPAKSKMRPCPGQGGQRKKQKTKQERGGQQTHLSVERSPSYPPMSGGLGSRSNRSGSVQSDDINDIDNTNGDEIHDPNPPDVVENTGITNNGNDLNDIGSPSGARRRGNSREGSVPPFNEWIQNGDARGEAGRHQNSIGDDVEDTRRQEEINGDIDEDEAFQRAVRESEEPSGGH